MPLAVTFALFGFNQERYVREAIAAAFAQQFDSLEIILSDDCSADRTFAIMKEMADAYEGPHRVRARREPVNAGTVQHLLNVAREATGDLLVVAAGDDISYPDRVRELAAAWAETGADALCSWHDEIDRHGNVIDRNLSFAHSPVTQKLFSHARTVQRPNGVVQGTPGFSAAYPRRFWAELPDPPRRQFVEDGLATNLINLRGGLIYRVPKSLVAYRLLEGSMSVRREAASAEATMKREDRIDFIARDLVGAIDYLRARIDDEGLDVSAETWNEFRKLQDHARLRIGIWSDPFPARWARLASARSIEDWKFLVPRLFGQSFFTRLRGFSAPDD